MVVHGDHAAAERPGERQRLPARAAPEIEDARRVRQRAEAAQRLEGQRVAPGALLRQALVEAVDVGGQAHGGNTSRKTEHAGRKADSNAASTGSRTL